MSVYTKGYQYNDIAVARSSILNNEQVARLNHVMNDTVEIFGNGNFPTIKVCFRNLVDMVRDRINAQYVPGHNLMPLVPNNLVRIRSIRLNGGAASQVLTGAMHPINDLDLMFSVCLSGDQDFYHIKCAVLQTLIDLLPRPANRERLTSRIIEKGYVSKMVKVNTGGDRWSLISLGMVPGQQIVELKFVDRMRRPYEFSVDSFQIVLDSLLLFYRCYGRLFRQTVLPSVVCESVYGNFHDAMFHLQNKMIVTRNPEEIRGGGLFKYCNLLSRNYIPYNNGSVNSNNFEQYMCTRFFIDFPNILQFHEKLNNYLKYHFCAPGEEHMKIQFLYMLMEVLKCSIVSEKYNAIALIKQLWLQQIADQNQYYYCQYL